MFGANRKKFMEGGIESDYTDDSSLYYTQQSMFPPHRPDKDVSPLPHRVLLHWKAVVSNVTQGVIKPPGHVSAWAGS